jgi:hypothetical protein
LCDDLFTYARGLGLDFRSEDQLNIAMDAVLNLNALENVIRIQRLYEVAELNALIESRLAMLTEIQRKLNS